MATRHIGLVYGGGNVGVMGIIANAMLASGGEVIGVIPQHLAQLAVAHTGVDLRIVGTMHERKALMAELADGFIALPGGLGTLEEFFEVLTWAQLGLHRKPCSLLNVCGYYNGLMSFIDQSVQAQFIHPGHRSLILIEEDVEVLLDRLAAYEPPLVDKAGWALKLAARNSEA